MKTLLTSLFIIILCHFSYAGIDTTWLNQHWRSCKKDEAVYFAITEKRDGAWKQQMYFTKTNQLFMVGDFEDPACIIKTGSFTWYNDTGGLTDSIIYKNNKPVYLNHFHDNGKVKTLLLYDSSGRASYVNSWNKYGEISYCDTFYHDRLNNECHKDTAWIKGIIKNEDSIWHLRFYYMDDGKLYINSYYKERLCRTRIGIFTKYVNGKINDSILYNANGRKIALWQFHNNCSLSAYKTFDSAGNITGGKYWTENGNELSINPHLKFPVAPGGFRQWKKNVIAKLNNDQSIDRKDRSGYYGSVNARMTIDKFGKIQAVYIDDPSPFAGMDALIIKTIMQMENWKPGAVDDKPTDFTMYCKLSFTEGKFSGQQEIY